MVQCHLLLTSIGTWYNLTRHFSCNEGGIFNDIPSRSKEAMIQKLLGKEIARNWRAFNGLAKANAKKVAQRAKVKQMKTAAEKRNLSQNSMRGNARKKTRKRQLAIQKQPRAKVLEYRQPILKLQNLN